MRCILIGIHFLDDSEQALILTEYVKGGALSNWIFNCETELPNRKKLDVSSQIASGLAFLDELNVVHRDLKTDDILFDGHSAAKIAYFGQSVHMMGAASIAVCRAYGEIRFRPPEFFADADDDVVGQIITKADIWSLGCVLVEVFAALHVWQGWTSQELLQSVALDGKAPFELLMVRSSVKELISTCFSRFEGFRQIPGA